MVKWFIAFILFAIGLYFLIHGVVIPLVKNKKCTLKINSCIISEKDKSFSADDGTTYNYANIRARYFYQGKTYTTKVSIGNNRYKACIPLRINPAKPEMCMVDSKPALINLLVISTGLFIGFTALSVLWVIAVIYSLI